MSNSKGQLLITAADIVKLLRARHCDDVFVRECAIGGKANIRLDGWAMRRSWSKPSFVGYEIKVSRQDFLRDDKWLKYLQYCTQFYFVCPAGLIDPSEVGDRAGVMYVSKGGGRLFIKKKAPPLESCPVARDELMKAVLMTRVKIVDSTFGNRPMQSDEEYWREWLASKEDRRILGRSVSAELKRRVSEGIDRVETENVRLRNENFGLKAVDDFLTEHGIDKTNRCPVNELDRKLYGQLKTLRFLVDRGWRAFDRTREMLDEYIEKNGG